MHCEASYRCSSLAVLAERVEPLTPKWGHNVGFIEAYRTERKPRQYTWYFPPNQSVFTVEPSAERIAETANTVTAVITAACDIQGETIAEIEAGFAALAYAIKGTTERGGYIDARITEVIKVDQDVSGTIEVWTARVQYRVLWRAQDPSTAAAEAVAVAGQMLNPLGELVGDTEAG